MASSSYQQGNDHLKFISNSPHFFKIILQDTIQNGKLGIPRKFVKNHGNSMSSPAMLSVPSGEVWKVELTKCNGKIWFENGWLEFSNHYSLEFGHLLVFRYDGNSNFHVVIFDRTATEILYPYTRYNHIHRRSNIDKSKDDDSTQNLEDISTSRKLREKSQMPCPQPCKMMHSTNSAIKTEIECNGKSEFLAQQIRYEGCPARNDDKSTRHRIIQQLKPHEKDDALERASKTFKSENPFFLVVMQPSYVGLSHSKGYRLVSNQLSFR
ncbi:B3 domain-containing transcription factor VRN1-like [Gossypium arboreum]|uniref:B3 domain-containing transcription factor VRN1-like n=1 Tax=Gossypium arboreum TaxID=29729 RepID=UPI0022F151AE|nr:B3 domain-containing transcription factor VRN1-like [Gossypium arboreum]